MLKLFFNPNPLIQALDAQARWNAAAAQRELELEQRQSEWNALHYELLQRMLTEVAQLSVEAQSIAARIESLSAKVDFNERRVRGIERVVHESALAPAAAASSQTKSGDEPPTTEAAGPEVAGQGDARRRRRRRRGRRSPGEGQPVGSPQDRHVAPPLSAVVDDEGPEPAPESEPLAAQPAALETAPPDVPPAREAMAAAPTSIESGDATESATPAVVQPFASPSAPTPDIAEEPVDAPAADERAAVPQGAQPEGSAASTPEEPRHERPDENDAAAPRPAMGPGDGRQPGPGDHD
jgi:hypothetical protein